MKSSLRSWVPHISPSRLGESPARWVRLALPLILASLLSVVPSSRFIAAAPRLPLVQVETQDQDGVTFSVLISEPAVKIGVDAEGYRTVEIATLGPRMAPGEPRLPALVISIGVPDGAEVRLSAEAGLEREIPGPPMRREASPTAGASSNWREAPHHENNGVSPAQRYTIEETRFRSLRLAGLQIHPARYDSDSGNLRLTSLFRFRIDFIGGEGFRSGAALSPLERRIVERSLLNADTVLASRAAPLTAGPRRAEGSAAPGIARTGGDQQFEPLPYMSSVAAVTESSANPGVKTRVAADGLVRVTRTMLEGVGFNPGPVDPRNLEVSFRGAPIPCRVTGQDDGTFDPGDAIEFYATRNRGRFSSENVYWLEEKAGPGLRFSVRNASPGAAPVATSFPHPESYEEGNSIYTFGKPAREGNPHFFWVWFEDNPNPPRVTTFTHTSALQDLQVSGPAARLRAFFAGRTDPTANPDHHVRFFVNGVAIGESTWNGQTFHTADLAFDPTLLVAGPNAVRFDYLPIALPDIYYLDWFEVVYPRLTQAVSDRLVIAGEGNGALRYEVRGIASTTDAVVLDITDPLAPAALSGFIVSGNGPYTLSFQDAAPAGKRFLVAGDGGRIAPSGLVLDVPSTLRAPQNGADEIIIVPEGWEPVLEPLAAHRRSQGVRVVLVNLTDVADEFAGGNVDDVAIRDFLAHAYVNWQAPPVSHLLLVGEPNMDVQNYLARSPFYHLMPTHLGVTAAQGETVTDTWFGAVSGPDLLPDVAVGRLSVRTKEEATALVNKIIAYETTPPASSPWGQNILLIASNESPFEASLEKVTPYLPPQFTVDRQYRRLGATTSSIRSAFDRGALIATFVGHGNVEIWADSSSGPFFSNADVAAISNAARLPFVTALNCLNGSIGHPNLITSLSEQFNNLTATGALAVWSPAALGFLSEYDALQPILYRTIFQDHTTELGLAALSSLVETYLTAPISFDVVKEMIFLGDPAGWLGLDSDADGRVDHDEILEGADPNDADTDDDGLADGQEGGLREDSDGDGVLNVLDGDSDEDGLPDGLEMGIAVPGADTDLSRGVFRADLDPASRTNPRAADSDGGGSADGAEDRNVNGAVDGGETNPLSAADDPSCNPEPPPEIAVSGDELLALSESGDDLRLSWHDLSPSSPCLLYRVYAADDFLSPSGKAAFRLLTTTPASGFRHISARTDGLVHRYLIAGWTLSGGEGPWGHFEP